MGSAITMGNVNGYLSQPPKRQKAPGVIVVQEWWGLNDNIRGIADRFAAEGYLAFAPDLYDGELAQFGENDKAMGLVNKHAPGAPAKLQGVFDSLKAHPACSGKVGSVGFCFGGRMSLLLAIHRPLDACCTFYGGRMETIFDQLGNIRCPVLGLFGDADVSIPAGAVQEFERLLALHNIQHEVKMYPNSGHAFFREDDPKSFRPEAAADAWVKVKKFFSENLN